VKWSARAAYAMMIAATCGVFAALRALGARLVAPLPAASVPFGDAGVAPVSSLLPHVLLALFVIVVTARALGAAFARFEQPPVVGEMVAGILLGPSLLGQLAPSLAATLFPASALPSLGIIAQIGVVLFMFLVGLELDTTAIKARKAATVAVSHASITVPLVLGGCLAIFLYPRLSTRDVPFFPFALFVGVSMSVTAFPVLARILSDGGLQRTPLGVIALTCAAIDDVTAWCLLALVVGVAKASTRDAWITIALSIAFVAVMLGLVRPFIERKLAAQRGVSQSLVALTLTGLIASALVTETIGIHALFGAFLVGAIIPHDSALAEAIYWKLTDVVVILFLPVFFAFTGLRTQIGLVSGLASWAIVALIIGVATLGKFGGSFVAARFTGLGNRDAASLGVLMNTRGLMELVVLNVGLDLRILSPALFTMLVLMALVTTFMTSPILRAIRRRDVLEGAASSPSRL
jgi:Kef-type K+ transport system membrane component KefB